MSRKIWLITAAILVAVGLVTFAVAMTVMDWDFLKLGNSSRQTNEYEIVDEFKSISISTSTAKVEFIASDEEKCRVVCEEWDNLKHGVEVKDGVLTITFRDDRKWHEMIGFNFGESEVSVYLPKGEYRNLFIESSTGDINVPDGYSFQAIDLTMSTGDLYFASSASGSAEFKASTGDIKIENSAFGSLYVSRSTGKTTIKNVETAGDIKLRATTGDSLLSDVKCENLFSEADTGDLTLKSVIASKRFDIERSTGDIKFDACDAGEISVETDTGSVTGTLLTNKIFIAETDTGRVELPDKRVGGKCEIETDTGDIKIQILEN